MSRTRRFPVLLTSLTLAVGLTGVLAACAGPDDPTPTRSPSASATRTPAPSSTPTPTTPATSAPVTGDPSAAPAPEPSEPAATPTDGSGQGTGNGSGADAPATVDWSAVTAQGVAAAGGGSVVSIAGSGDQWTVVVAGPDGSQTQSVVSATLGRVTSGPFPKDVDAATKAANVARTSGLRTQADAAATVATGAVAGSTLSSLTLGGTAAAPSWTATVQASGTTSTVRVDGLTGAASVG
ncbi:hypothetical protein E9228_002863 [Curtobacterium flaccumfaciens]|uniref:PepSY domain-containing protein n=1 Tax=Curtobacterium salicis TaxID=1779862 RepID=A0ABX0T9J8_9MICO|nr:hypothetical protein [Curtobacterium sp. WW7]NII42205.1 hypothetical protein [Curtobacterium sp. WW7]